VGVSASTSTVLLPVLCLGMACGTDTTGPAAEGRLQQISAGSPTCGLALEGTVYCWGLGSYSPSVVTMPAGVTPTSLSVGNPMCVLSSAGVPYCWDPDQPRMLTPVSPPSGVSFDRLYGGTAGACGLTSAGAAYCWGDNQYGQLGDGSTTDRTTPTLVAAPQGVTFASLDLGWLHTCGLTPGGRAFCWGDNSYGMLGDGTETERHSPTEVMMPAGVTFATLAAGIIHNCALTPSGAAYCWGAGHRARLGNGTDGPPQPTPVAVLSPPGVTFTDLEAGYGHTCGITPDGAALCWGRNGSGALGDGTNTDRSLPTPVVWPGGVRFTGVSTGWVHTCAIASDGFAYCWGANDTGQLGDGTGVDRLTPVRVRLP